MININERLIEKILPKAQVIDKQIGKLGREETPALLILKGIPFEDNSAFFKKLYLIVVTNDNLIKLDLKPGYDPKMSLLDFTGDGGDEIYISIDSGGSGGFQFFYVIELIGQRLKILADDEIFNSSYNNYSGKYLDYYKVQISDDNNSVFIIDLSCKGSDYLSRIYDENGKLIQDKKAYVSGANYTYPAYNQKEQRYDLVVYQRITGLYNADNLGYLVTKLSFNERGSISPARTFLETSKQQGKDCVFRY